MNIDLYPKPPSGEQLKRWSSQSLELIKRRPVDFLLANFVLGLICFLISFVSSRIAELIAKDSIVLMPVGIVIALFGIVFAISFVPFSQVMMNISENADTNRKTNIIDEFTTAFFVFGKEQFKIAFGISLKFALVVGSIFATATLLISFLGESQSMDINQQANPGQIEGTKEPVTPPEIPLVGFLSGLFGFPVMAITVVGIFSKPYLSYAINKCLVSMDMARKISYDSNTAVWFMGSMLYPLFIIMLSMPTWSYAGLFNPVLFTIGSSFYWAFMYVSGREIHGGKKENEDAKSYSGEFSTNIV